QQAFIRFTDNNSVQPFYDEKWSTLILKDSVRVLPLGLTADARDARRAFVIKLTALPPKTTAHDIIDILQETKAQTCFIPRKMGTYNSCNYAYLSFRSEELLENAISIEYFYGNRELFWTPESQHTCHYCGSPDHLVTACPIRNEKKDISQSKKFQDNKLNKLYNKYRPAQHKKRSTSYAAAVKSNSEQNKDPATEIRNQQISDDTRNDIVQQLQNIQTVLNDLSKSVADLTIRIDTLEQPNNKPLDGKIQPTSHKKPVKPPTTNN